MCGRLLVTLVLHTLYLSVQAFCYYSFAKVKASSLGIRAVKYRMLYLILASQVKMCFFLLLYLMY